MSWHLRPADDGQIVPPTSRASDRLAVLARTTLEHSPHGYAVLEWQRGGADACVVDANAAFWTLTGWHAGAGASLGSWAAGAAWLEALRRLAPRAATGQAHAAQAGVNSDSNTMHFEDRERHVRVDACALEDGAVSLMVNPAAALNTDALRTVLGEALSNLDDPERIQHLASKQLRDLLGVMRVVYADTTDDAQFTVVRAATAAREAPAMLGTHRLDGFGVAVARALRAGTTVVVGSVADDEALSKADLETYRAIGVGAHITVPMMRAGRLVAVLAVHSSEPRAWNPAEVALTEDIAQRTWTAVERARAMHDLRETNARFAQVVNTVSDAFWITTYPPDEIVYSSPRLEALTGARPPNAPGGASWAARVHPEDLERALAAYRAANGAAFEVQYRWVRADGDLVWLHDRVYPVLEQGREGGVVTRLVGVTRDITVERELETQLRRGTQRAAFRVELIDTLRDLTTPNHIGWATAEHVRAQLGADLGAYVQVTGQAPREIVWESPRPQDNAPITSLRMLGAPVLETLRSGISVHVTDIATDARLDALERAHWHARGMGALLLIPMLRADELGAVLVVASHTPRQWTLEDALVASETLERASTEIHRAFAQQSAIETRHDLEDTLAQLELALEATGIGLWEWHVESDELWWSAGQERLYGLEPGTFGGRQEDFAHFVHPEDASRMEQQVFAARRGETTRVEFRVRRADGAERWIYAISKPVLNEFGQLERMIGANLDLTDLKRAEVRLREINEAQRRFVSDAAHELRAPLTSIRGNLSLLARYPNMDLAERVAAAIEAERETARLSRLISDLLLLARGESKQAVSVEGLRLDAVLEEAWQGARALSAEHHFELESLEAVRVDGDPDALKQLALTLLENAVKYTPAGGTVRLSLRSIAGQAQIRVTDSGYGIPPEDLERVFERFYRVDRARTPSETIGGTGLGLTIARQIATAHAGTVHLESAPGAGTTAVVHLPVTAV
jgi:PAS domain S-box-containing protein